MMIKAFRTHFLENKAKSAVSTVKTGHVYCRTRCFKKQTSIWIWLFIVQPVDSLEISSIAGKTSKSGTEDQHNTRRHKRRVNLYFISWLCYKLISCVFKEYLFVNQDSQHKSMYMLCKSQRLFIANCLILLQNNEFGQFLYISQKYVLGFNFFF